MLCCVVTSTRPCCRSLCRMALVCGSARWLARGLLVTRLVLASWRSTYCLFGPGKRTLSISSARYTLWPAPRTAIHVAARAVLGTLPPALTMFLLPLRSRPRPPATLPSSPARIITVGLRAAGRRRTTRRCGLGSHYSWRLGGAPSPALPRQGRLSPSPPLLVAYLLDNGGLALPPSRRPSPESWLPGRAPCLKGVPVLLLSSRLFRKRLLQRSYVLCDTSFLGVRPGRDVSCLPELWR